QLPRGRGAFSHHRRDTGGLVSHNPFIGERQPLAWGGMLGLLRSGEWIAHRNLRAAGVVAGVSEKTSDNILGTAQKYGVVARRGSWSQKLKKDFREYWLLPRDVMNEAQRLWIDVPADFKCPCGSPAVGRFKSKHTGNWNWMCSAHMEASK